MIFSCLIILSLTPYYYAFNIDEINSVYYDIDILGKPIVKEKFDEDVMLMVNRLGQEYACSLPSLPSDLKGQGRKDDSAAHEESVDISGLLKPMEAAPCLVTTKDWWTYEFCYGHVIKQYHLEDGKSSGLELILGKYESEYDWSSGGKGGADASASGNSNRLQRFHSQFYTNGTKCDLTGEPRKAEVRFKCESDIGDFIERVDEPESCRYIVTVATSKVCHHPYLRPHPDRTPHHIRCSPVLTTERYTQYTTQQDKKRQIAEEATTAALENTQLDDDEDRISIEVINFGDSLKLSDHHKKRLNKFGSSFSRLPTLTEAEGKTAPSTPSAAAEEAEDATDTTGVDEGVAKENGPETADKEEDVVVEEDNTDDAAETDDKKKTSLDRFIEQFGERINQVTSGDVASNIVKVREQLSENTAELQDLLEETLADLDRELEALAGLAEANGETAKLGLWRMLTARVRALQTKTEMLNNDRQSEPERGSPEWLQWRLKKNEKAITKAQETLGNVSDMKKLLTKKASVTDSEAEPTPWEKEKRAEKDEEDNFMDLFSGQFVDELLEHYVADQDAGSKEAETIGDKMQAKSNKYEEEDDHSVMIGSLQESIRNKLKKSGLDINKHKIEVKILTPGTLMEFRSGEEDKISAEQAHSVETLVIKLMGAQKEEIIEKQKHESLSVNYNFSFDETEDDPPTSLREDEEPPSDATAAAEGQ